MVLFAIVLSIAESIFALTVGNMESQYSKWGKPYAISQLSIELLRHGLAGQLH